MHRISFPELPGPACGVAPNALWMTAGTLKLGVPNDIALLPAPDTLRLVKEVHVCFTDSVVLQADGGKWHRWDNGLGADKRTVRQDGMYVLGYINNACKYEIDTFKVRFIPLPQIGNQQAYSCPGGSGGSFSLEPADTTTFTYRWEDYTGNLLQNRSGRSGDIISGLDTGLYRLRISTVSGCDTMLEVRVSALPVPEAAISADSMFCINTSAPFMAETTAPIAHWFFGDGARSTGSRPEHIYYHAGSYKVMLIATNIEGCADTAYKSVVVKSLDLELMADKEQISRGEQVGLWVRGSESFAITGWQPSALFADPSGTRQVVMPDSSTTFYVYGLSEYGCTGMDSVRVWVQPDIMIPSAFSPNGDGKNDFFRPLARGAIFIRQMEVYNRYGRQVFTAYGPQAQRGWDGTYGGKPAELGTYFYYINIETEQGEPMIYKGDITLVR
jgi:gliding motility-associated-like protein